MVRTSLIKVPTPRSSREYSFVRRIKGTHTIGQNKYVLDNRWQSGPRLMVGYGLEPPTSSALIELPGIPVPNRYSPTPTGRVKPAEIPDLPTSWKDKGKGKAKSIDTFQEEWGKAGWIAEEAYGGKAIRICSPNRLTEGSVKREGLTIWATVSGEHGVDSVKVFVGVSPHEIYR